MKTQKTTLGIILYFLFLGCQSSEKNREIALKIAKLEAEKARYDLERKKYEYEISSPKKQPEKKTFTKKETITDYRNHLRTTELPDTMPAEKPLSQYYAIEDIKRDLIGHTVKIKRRSWTFAAMSEFENVTEVEGVFYDNYFEKKLKVVANDIDTRKLYTLTILVIYGGTPYGWTLRECRLLDIQ